MFIPVAEASTILQSSVKDTIAEKSCLILEKKKTYIMFNIWI